MATFDDVRSTLQSQHAQIQSLMRAVTDGEGSERAEAFDSFRAFLAAHEAAEEEYVHTAETGARRVAEEDEAGRVIAELEHLGTDSEEFGAKFAELSRAVVEHAEAEEHEELPKLAGAVDDERAGRMLDGLAQVADIAASRAGAATSFLGRLYAAKNLLRTHESWETGRAGSDL